MHTTRRIVVVALAATAAMLLAAGPAWAHVEPDPNRVKPGKKVTVEFTPEHGCGKTKSVTTQMDFQVPKGAKSAKPVDQDGWSSSVKGRKITFASDKVPDQETSFGITFTAPGTRTLLSWKVVQRCQAGVERWIEGPKGELPAPIVGVGKNPPEESESGDEQG
ncbi:MAG TPA: hypothetical protein VIH82_12935 [Acidimicrobiia bacterium]|jgi:uncharacterized protein YcnI